MNVREVMKNLLVGFMIGIAFVLPGISGAVIAVVFGLYERALYIVSDLKRNLRSNLLFVITLALGVLIGVFAFSKIMNHIPVEYESVILLGFIGLIVGQIPEVYKLARKNNEPVKTPYVLWLVIGFAILLPLLLIDSSSIDDVATDHSVTSFVLALLVGLIMGSTAIVPGLNGPTILIALGLYSLFTVPFDTFDLFLLLPLGVGVIFGLILVSKVIVRILDSHYYHMYYAILGLTIGSMVLAVFEVDPEVDILLGIVALIIGLVVSLSFLYFENRLVPETEEPNS